MGRQASTLRNVAFERIATHVRIPLYRNAYALMLSSATTSGLGLLYWMLAARLYSDSQVGTSAAVVSTMVLLSSLAQLNLKGALTRFIPVAGRATSRLIRYAYLISVVLSALVASAFLAGVDIFAPAASFLKANLGLALWFVLSTMAWSIFVLQDSALTGLRQTVWVPIENTLFGIAKIILLIICSTALPQYGIFASWTIPSLAVLLPVNLLIFRRLVPEHMVSSEDRSVPIEKAQVARFVAGDYLGSLFVELSTSLLPVLVLTQAGASANAYFYLAWVIAYSLQLVSMNLSTSLMVEGSRDQRRVDLYARRVIVQMARLIIPAVLAVVIAAPSILRLFGSSYALEGANVLRLLALSAIPFSVNALYLSVARVRRQIKGMILVQGTLCVLALALSDLLIHEFNITGVGIAWLAAQTAVAVVLLLTELRPLWRTSVMPSPEGAV